ncbi:MAG TPA: hypothetical protein VHD76_09785 [Bryobacteraceae bacterium]|jgi:hypothetical protein|nr:hypothetical protein [Bryobacteraceae bacterium]
MRLRNCPAVWLVSLAAAVPLVFAQASFPVVSAVDEPEIAGRPVQLDAAGKLLPWPIGTDTGYSYNSYLLAQWSILWDQHNRQRYPYFYCCFDFDRTTFEMQPDNHWANSTAYLRAMMQGFIERLYPYTGDPNTIAFLEDFMNYELENGLTPEGYAWPLVPYTSANPGDRRYTGWSKHGEDYIEPHVVGEDGYAYLRFYEMTGNTKYLEEAIRCADALVKNYRPGDAKNSPWPVRCYARDGGLNGPGMGPYSANVVEPVMLFDELIRLGYGNTAAYRSVRQKAWEWLQEYPLKNNVWVGYFEDVKPSMENMNQVIPLEYARYVLLHPDKDPQWREHAESLIEWVKKTPKWPKYIVHGAMVTTEQGNGKTYCCNIPNQCCDSHTSRLAAVEALLARRTGDAALRESAFRSYNWVTYFQGMPPRAHAPFANQWWFTDQFSDGPRRLMDGLSAFPEWAPSDESHLVGSTSVVTRIAYGKGSVTYSTFDPASTDVLRLNFAPESVWAGGRKLTRRNDWNEGDWKEEGYTVDNAHILRIRHTQSREVDVRGDSDEPVPGKVDFDNPHLAAGSALRGQYPSGVIDWGESAWEVAGPEGKMSTFSIRAAQAAGNHAEFKFANPRMLVWIEAYNSSEKEVELTISSPEMRELTVSLKAGELRRIRTQWTERVSVTRLDSPNLSALRFDNIGYSLYLLGQPYR